MKLDPYKVLGVGSDSGPHEWKKAYRRLAMRWHPDRSDHPEATERFKEINVAYEQLLTGIEPEDEDVAEAAEEEAGAPEPEEAVGRAADIRLNFELSLEEAASGCRKTIHYSRGKACPTCDGSGEAGMSRTRFCDVCHGSGRVHNARRVLEPCRACGGRGFFTERICPDCSGSGRETTAVSLEITVPAGMLPGDELRLAGQGEQADAERIAGDLYLTLIIHSHPLYQLLGRDLHFSMPVSALAMMAGGEVEVPSLTGTFKLALEAGPAEAQTLRLAGKGYPGRGKRLAGDMVIELQPAFPRKLSARQRKLLLQANAALLDDAAEALPELAEWRQANGLV